MFGTTSVYLSISLTPGPTRHENKSLGFLLPPDWHIGGPEIAATAGCGHWRVQLWRAHGQPPTGAVVGLGGHGGWRRGGGGGGERHGRRGAAWLLARY